MIVPATRRIALGSCKAAASNGTLKRPVQLIARRQFHKTPTNAFYKALWQSTRVKVPWIDALTQSKKQSQGKQLDSTAQQTPVKLDLTPKRMADSYFSAVSSCYQCSFMCMSLMTDYVCQVLPLAEDKWLLDEYLNASGRIRQVNPFF